MIDIEKSNPFKEITTKELQKCNIHDLRDLGAKIGVKSATSLSKEKLIENILLINQGKIAPYHTKKGRPRTYGNIFVGKTEKNCKNKSDKKGESENKIETLLFLKKELIKNVAKIIEVVCSIEKDINNTDKKKKAVKKKNIKNF